MRDGLHRLRQSRRDGAPHAVELHLLVAAGGVERFDLLGCRAFGERRGRGRWSRCLLDVVRDDAAMGAGTADAAKIDAGLGGEPPRQRGDGDAAGEPRRAEIAFRRAHFKERIERHPGSRGPARSRRLRRRGGCRRLRGHELSLRRFGRDRCRRLACRHACPIGDDSHHRANRRHFARRNADFGQNARRRRRHFHRHLVGLDLEQIVARLDDLAGRLEPLGDLALGHGLAELRHQHVHECSSSRDSFPSP